jgi:hypothetical protein
MPPEDHLLVALARTRFTDLTDAEFKLLRAASRGEFAVCGPNMNDKDPANDPSKADEWGKNREIHAELIRWLCINRQAREFVDPKGVQAYGAKVTGDLNLSFVALAFPLTLHCCRIMEEFSLRGAEIPAIALHGTWVHSMVADGATVRGGIFLRDGFTAEKGVRLLGVKVGGGLRCDGATFKNPYEKDVEDCGIALAADRISVKGGIFLRDHFLAEGEVRLLGANIVGNLDCSGGTFRNPAHEGEPRSGHALSADFATVDGTVFLGQGFRAQGEVCFLGAEIGRDISCDKGTLVEGSGKGLSLDRAAVGGSVFLREGFSTEGDVRLLGVQIGADLECRKAKFAGVMNTQRACIKGGFIWIDIISPKEVRLSLKDTSVGALFDDMMSWPAPGNLNLDGFVYGRISIGPPDAKSRLGWLALQRGFSPQPYRQLAKVLRAEGDDTGARHVLFEMEHQRRTKADKNWYGRIWNWTLRKAVGYGYFPGRSLWGLAGLIIIGWFLFWVGFCAGSIVPTDKEAYSKFKLTGTVAEQHARFHGLVYSADNALPLVKLGQVDHWQPDPNPDKFVLRIASWGCSSLWISLAGFLMWFRWIQIAAGWFLATMGVAAVTGIVRKD